MPRPFMVVATQNPIDMEGTYVLPEAQLDRFLMKLTVGYPSAEAEAAVLRTQKMGPTVDRLQPVLSANDVMSMIAAVQHGRGGARARAVHRGDRRRDPHDVGTAARRLAARQPGAAARRPGLAASVGRRFVTPEDVKEMAPVVLAHRVILQPDAELQGRTGAELIARALQSVPVPARRRSLS